MSEITAEIVRAQFNYDPATGVITHGRMRNPRFRRGESATHRDRDGYLKVSAGGSSYKAHRIAWLYVHGEWPADQIDHINGKRDDNRIDNLRVASYSANGQNRATQKNNRCGYPGVAWIAARGKWRAQIAKDGVRHFLGSFATAEEARDAYLAAKAKLHDFQPAPRNMGQSMGRVSRRRATQ